MITLRKNGYRVEFEGTDTKFTRKDYDNNGRLIIIATYYDCSMSQSIKNYMENGWKRNIKAEEKIYIVKEEYQKDIVKSKDDEKIPEIVAMLICVMSICIVNKLVDELPDLIKEIKKYAKK